MSTAVTPMEQVAGEGRTTVGAPARGPRASSAVFDWTMTIFCAVFLGGIFLDGWAHTHGRVDETFLTPWHAVLYGGYVATASFLCTTAAWGVLHGRPGRAALPDGYGLSLLGAALWVIGGPFDFAWHAVFGFEADVEALMSPAHAVLALGFGLMASGPLRAGLRRSPGRWRDELPLVLSLTFVVSILTFFTQVAHPLANLFAASGRVVPHSVTELGIVGMLLTSALIVGAVLLLLGHGRLPIGSVVILVTLNSVAMGFLYDHGPYPRAAVVAMVVAGVITEVLRFVLRPAPSRPGAVRAFAFAFPAVLSAAYFIGLGLMVGIAWSPHLWLGTVVFAGVTGWLLSYLVLAPCVRRS